jgi:hypothetical protein
MVKLTHLYSNPKFNTNHAVALRQELQQRDAEQVHDSLEGSRAALGGQVGQADAGARVHSVGEEGVGGLVAAVGDGAIRGHTGNSTMFTSTSSSDE